MKKPSLVFLAVLATALLLDGGVDPGKRSESFAHTPEEKKEFTKERSSLGGSRGAADEKIEFVTIPMTDTRAAIPGVQKMQSAPIAMKARSTPTRQAVPGAISTDARAPSKFDKKSKPVMAPQFNDSMAEANRVKTSTLKPEGKRTVIERINRFVFRRNEKPSAVTPAGESGEQSGQTDKPEKSGSGSR